MTFRNDKISISDENIELLRNNFVYKTIDYHEIKNVRITKDHEIKRWHITFFAGVLFFIIPMIIFINLIFSISSYNINYAGMASINAILKTYVSLIFPMIMGVLFLIKTFSFSMVLKFIHANKKYHFSLKDFEKENKLNELKAFLKTKLGIVFE